MDFKQNLWIPSPKSLKVEDGETHIWRAFLEEKSLPMLALFNVLAIDEQNRASKYLFKKDREHFIVARGALRMILSRYLGIQPDKICFSYNSYGKPELNISEAGGNTLQFNVSHSGGVALYAITRAREIGIDIEYMREANASLDVADRFFSSLEVSIIRGLPSCLQTAAFFTCWTRKEAYIKAIGMGLARSLSDFSVFILQRSPTDSLSINDIRLDDKWSLMTLPTEPDFMAALAVAGPIGTLRYFNWSY